MDRLIPALAPMLLISIGYVDPGKWAATIDGGARFGLELVLMMLVFSCAAILCQYLSAVIGVVTRRNLAESDTNEASKQWCRTGILVLSSQFAVTSMIKACVLLGVQTELSAFALDLTMVLGIAHVLSLLLGVNLLACIFFTAADAVIIPLCANRLETYKEKSLCIGLAALVMIIYVLGVLFGQPETPLSMNGILTKLSGESTFALMRLLGANILPHNFYLHSPPPAFDHAHAYGEIISRLDGMNSNFETMNSRLNGMDTRVQDMSARVGSLSNYIVREAANNRATIDSYGQVLANVEICHRHLSNRIYNMNRRMGYMDEHLASQFHWPQPPPYVYVNYATYGAAEPTTREEPSEGGNNRPRQSRHGNTSGMPPSSNGV